MMASIFRVVLGASLALGCTYTRSPAELADIAQRKLWTRTLPNNFVIGTLTRGGLVHGIVAKSLDSRATGERWFIDLATGEPLWQGPASGSFLVSDLPSPVFARQDAGQVVVAAVDAKTKQVRWSRNVPGRALLAATAPRGDRVLVIVADASAPAPQVTAVALRADTGEPAFSVPLGQASLSALPHPRALVFSGDMAVLALGDLLASVDVAGGVAVSTQRVAWPAVEQKDAQPPVVRVGPGGQVAVAYASAVTLLAPAGTPLWSAPRVLPGIAHDLAWHGNRVAVCYRPVDGGDAGLVVFDAAGTAVLSHKGPEPGSRSRIRVNGLVVQAGRAYWSAHSQIIGVDLQTGSQLFSAPIPKRLREDGAALIARERHFVVLGQHAAAALGYDGRPLWASELFRTPAEAMVSKSYLGDGETYWASASTNDLVEQTLYGDGSGPLLDNAFTAFFLKKGVWLARNTRPQRYAGFVRAADEGKLISGIEANVVLLDLENGATTERGLVAGNMACAVNAIIDDSAEHAFVAVEAVGLACGRAPEITGFKLR